MADGGGVAFHRPTMQDVARKAGVSTATVSRVLAGVAGTTSPKTEKRVRQAAASLGYVVNGVAASLRNRQSSSIGLILADVSNPFFGLVTRGVEEAVTREGYGLILANSGNDIDEEKRLLHLMLEKQVDAIVVASSAPDASHIQKVIDRGVPVVLVDTAFDDIASPAVVVDNEAAAHAATLHLLELGHRQIAIVTGALTASFDKERLAGYELALKEAGLPVRKRLILQGDSTFEGGRAATAEAFRKGVPLTAIFGTNNLMTTGILRALGEAGLSVPQDVSVLGFDDMDWYELCSPRISAVAQPAREMGLVAGQRLLERLASGVEQGASRIILETKLILRASTAPPATIMKERIQAG